MKLFVLIFFLLTILTGCGMHIHLLEGSAEVVLTKPPAGDHIPARLWYIRMYCPVCWECIPEFISNIRWHTTRVVCNDLYCCRQTGEEFNIRHQENERIIWVNYWEDWPPPDWPYEPEPDYPDKFDSTHTKDDRGEIADPPKPPRRPPDKKPRAKSYSGLAKHTSDD